MGTKKKLEQAAEKQDKKIKRLYALIWFLACPLVYVAALLLKFTQINVVYWTLLIIPVLLAVYNVRQVPPVATKKTVPTLPQNSGEAEPDGEEAPLQPESGVTHTQWVKLMALALKAPVILAVPILATVVIALFFG